MNLTGCGCCGYCFCGCGGWVILVVTFPLQGGVVTQYIQMGSMGLAYLSSVLIYHKNQPNVHRIESRWRSAIATPKRWRIVRTHHKAITWELHHLLLRWDNIWILKMVNASDDIPSHTIQVFFTYMNGCFLYK